MQASISSSGKVERGLGERAQFDQRRRPARRWRPRIRRCSERNAAARRLAGSRRRSGRRPLRPARGRACLEEGAPRELAGLGDARAGIEAGARAAPASRPGRRGPAARAPPRRYRNAAPGNTARGPRRSVSPCRIAERAEGGAARDRGSSPSTAAAIARPRGPETRTTPMPPRPRRSGDRCDRVAACRLSAWHGQACRARTCAGSAIAARWKGCC